MGFGSWVLRKAAGSRYGALKKSNAESLKRSVKRNEDKQQARQKEAKVAEEDFERRGVRAVPGSVFEQFSYKKGKGGWL